MSDHLKDLYKAASKGFLTSETCGPDGKYLYVCRFRNMDDLNAYEDTWRAAMLAVRDGGSMRQVPEVLVKANDEIGNCPLRSPARSIAIRQFHALAGEYVRRLIDEANPAPPTSWDVQECPDCVVTEWATGYKCAECQGGACPTPAVCAAVIAKREPTPAQAGAELPETIPCQHERTHTGYDYVSCLDCGAFRTDSGWGIAKCRWFVNREEAVFYRKNGRLPDRLARSGSDG